jgi:hypothetical protein
VVHELTELLKLDFPFPLEIYYLEQPAALIFTYGQAEALGN